jgi:hypothetical protein
MRLHLSNQPDDHGNGFPPLCALKLLDGMLASDATDKGALARRKEGVEKLQGLARAVSPRPPDPT